MTSTHPKILQIGKFHPIRGGVEKVMLDITTGLSQLHGIDCDMLCAASKGAYTVTLTPHARIFAVRTLAKVKATMLSPAMILRLRRIASDYDIIHIHHPDPMAALALRLSGFKGKVVLHWHSDILRQRQLLRLFRPIQSWLLRRADAIVATSQPYLENSPWLTPYRDKCHCIPIGINAMPGPKAADIEGLRRRFGNRRIIFSMGRLVPYKGFEHLIDATRSLPDDFVVVIGGTGPLRDALQRRISDAGLSNRVILTGYIPDADLPAFYHAAELFVLSSIERTEAFGVVQIEAMACGCPVVATEIPVSGVPWVNAHGVSGLNVAPRNPQALADAILEVSRQRNRFSQGASSRFKSLFTLPAMIESIRNLYTHLPTAPDSSNDKR